MTKRLIYYFYLTKNFKENRANRINLECLRRYANIFDRSDVYLSLDDTSDMDLIHEAEAEFLSMPFNGNISFTVIKNGRFCESDVIKHEIVDKLDTLDSLVFFAHAKGYTNINVYKDTNLDGIQKWIVGCYFLSLSYMDEVEKYIDGENSISVYGSFPVCAQKKITEDDLSEFTNIFPGYIRNNWYYSGSFFWINTSKLYNFIHVFSPEMPKMVDRYYGERFLGNLFKFERNGQSHNNRYMFPCNFYNPGIVDNALDFILEGDEHEQFNEFYNEIISKV